MLKSQFIRIGTVLENKTLFLVGFNALFWLIAAILFALLSPNLSGYGLIQSLLFLESVLYVIGYVGIKRNIKIIYLGAVVLSFGNSLLSITDQLGVVDIFCLGVSFVTFISLVLRWRRVFNKSHLPYKYPDFIAAFTQWASKLDHVECIAVVGSHARGTARSDSDVDVMVITTDPQFFIVDQSWVTKFGPVVRSQLEDYGLVQAIRVFYEKGLEVEYCITTPEWLSTTPIDGGTKRVISDGVKAYFDRHGRITDFLKALADTSE
ncbi:nucleotidyltransferase domain-containing protein [candidate division WWE3 bacterium]|nr:nucleotidyltransferase domain-containing protein [candidate division WWE3 bacterium]